MSRVATCRCGQLSATCDGDPVRISVCHCLNCRRRSGSAFAVQARFPAEQVALAGVSRTFTQAGDAGSRATFHFCPECGSDVWYVTEGAEETVAIPAGAFADPAFPAPGVSVYESRKSDWLTILVDDVERPA